MPRDRAGARAVSRPAHVRSVCNVTSATPPHSRSVSFWGWRTGLRVQGPRRPQARLKFTCVAACLLGPAPGIPSSRRVNPWDPLRSERAAWSPGLAVVSTCRGTLACVWARLPALPKEASRLHARRRSRCRERRPPRSAARSQGAEGARPHAGVAAGAPLGVVPGLHVFCATRRLTEGGNCGVPG